LERYFNTQFYKNKKQEKQQQQHFFVLLGVTENRITQNYVFFIFFKFGKVVEDYHLLFPSKPLEGDIFYLVNIDF
jgi:hypothetical protein